MTICESCGQVEVPENNKDRVCAFQIEIDVPVPDYKGAITCNCCDLCRENCHEALLNELTAHTGKEDEKCKLI